MKLQSLEDAREDFMYDVYNILDFLPTNDEANRIIDSFDRVTNNIKQEPVLDKIRAEIKELPITDTAVKLVTEVLDKYCDYESNKSEIPTGSITKNDLAQERYQDLIDYFGDEKEAKTILESRKEFKAWLERLRWHVKRVAELDGVRAEIEQVEINGYIRDVECFRAGLNTAVKIIDKYKVGSEG